MNKLNYTNNANRKKIVYTFLYIEVLIDIHVHIAVFSRTNIKPDMKILPQC